jgi:hypothetical protein
MRGFLPPVPQTPPIQAANGLRPPTKPLNLLGSDTMLKIDMVRIEPPGPKL